MHDVLVSGWLTHGPKNTEFEEMFAAYIGVKYAVSMNSCASALFASLKAYNITAKDFSLAFITNDGSKPNGVPAIANWIAVGV